jgi:hypothetical protein
MITEKQRDNIYKLPIEDVLQIALICNERLGIVTSDKYSKEMNIPLRTVYEQIDSGKILCFEVAGKKFPSINLNLINPTL